MREWFRLVSLLLSPILLVSGILGIVGADNLNTVWKWFLTAAIPWTVPLLTLANFLLLLLILVSIYAFLRSVKKPQAPIEVLSTKVSINVDRNDHSKYTVFTEQYLRANRPDVSAYYNNFSPSPNGEVLANISTSIDGYCGTVIEQEPESPLQIGTEKSGWDCIQVFKQPLPYPFYAPLVPSFMLVKQEPQRMSSLLRRMVVRRTTTVNFKDDPNIKPQYHLITAQRYPQRNITIILTLPVGFVISKEKVIARHRRENAVYRETVDWTSGNTCSVYFKSIRREAAGIYWES